jgi:hypothetical protein
MSFNRGLLWVAFHRTASDDGTIDGDDLDVFRHDRKRLIPKDHLRIFLTSSGLFDRFSAVSD